MALSKIQLLRYPKQLGYAVNSIVNERSCSVQVQQQKEDRSEQLIPSVKTANVRTLKPWYIERNVSLFGRESACRTGELFYRTVPGLKYDGCVKFGICLPMLRDYCTPSLWSHKFMVAVSFIWNAAKHLNANIKGNGANFMDIQMREDEMQRKMRSI